MYSVDWATIKTFQIYNVKTKKLVEIKPTEDAFNEFFNNLPGSHSFYIEEGGADTFKLLALKNGQKVYTISGKKIKAIRESLSVEKTDENDARIIGKVADEHLEYFHKFNEGDKLTAKIGVLHREYVKIVKDSTQKKNQLLAFENKLALLVSENVVKKIIDKRKATIKALASEISTINSQLTKLIQKAPIWENYLKDIKGVGPITAAGIIGSVKDITRFPNRYSLRHFAGMITKQGNPDYNRHLKQALYNFVEGIIQNRTEPWRALYDNMKLFYKGKHEDWTKGKVDNFAKKFVQTKFLDRMYKECA